MKHIFYVFMGCMLALSGCANNNKSTNSKEDLADSKNWEENAIFTEKTYRIYEAQGNVIDGMIYMGVTKEEYESGKVTYSIYTNFQRNYSNTFSFSCITYDEDEIPVIMRFLDKCQESKAAPITEGFQSLKYQGKSSYGFIYSYEDNTMLVDDEEGNRYRMNMSISEIRNLFAGAKERIESLKKEN